MQIDLNKMSKVVIIGSGLGGLTCGYILQKNGYDVTILEQGIQLGGCLQCFVRKGAKFETGMHFIGSAATGQTMDRIFNFLDIKDQIKLSSLDTKAYNTISLAGSEFSIPNGIENFYNAMSSYFPHESDALRKYIDIVDRISSASSLNSLTSSNRDIAANTEYQLRTINDVLDELFTDEMIKNVLVGDLSLYSAEYDKTPFSQHAFIMDFYNQSSYRIAGGSDTIALSLIKNIEQLGGTVLSRKKVVKIHCDETKATGVETEDEQFYPADYVISTVHPNRMLEMLDTKMIRPAFRTRINSIPQTAGGFAVYVKFKENTMPYMNTNYYGYAGKSPWGCEHYTSFDWPKGYLYMHMCHEDGAVWAKSGVVLSYMNMDDVIKWKGTRIGRRGEDYEAFKKLHAELLIQEVEKQHPGFAASIDCYYTSTPLTYLDYTGTENGSMYGVAKDVNLGPAGRVPYRIKVPNILLAGQNVNSHGMLGVMVGTIVTCSELVSAEKIYKQIDESNHK